MRAHDCACVGGAIGTVEATKIATGVDDLLKVEIHGTKGAITLDLSDADHLMFFDETDPEAPYGGERGFKKIRASQRYPAPAAFPPFKNSSGWLGATRTACIRSSTASTRARRRRRRSLTGRLCSR